MNPVTVGTGGMAIAGVLVTAIILIAVVSRRFRRSTIAILMGASMAVLALGALLMVAGPAPRAGVVQPTPAPAAVPIPTDVGGKAPEKSAPLEREERGLLDRLESARPENEVRGTIPNMILVALSFVALLALARVTVDGRKNGGYGTPARIFAALSFAALCGLLWALGPMV